MRFNNRSCALLEIPDLPINAFTHHGDRKIKPQGGGGIIGDIVGGALDTVGNVIDKAVSNPLQTAAIIATAVAAPAATDSVAKDTTAAAGTFTTLSATNTLSIYQTIEAVYQQSGYGTSQSIAYTNGGIYYLTGMTGNFTFNWTRVPTTTSKSIDRTSPTESGEIAW